MKISKTKLRQIIKEELSKDDISEGHPFGYTDLGEEVYQVRNFMKQIWELTNEMRKQDFTNMPGMFKVRVSLMNTLKDLQSELRIAKNRENSKNLKKSPHRK